MGLDRPPPPHRHLNDWGVIAFSALVAGRHGLYSLLKLCALTVGSGAFVSNPALAQLTRAPAPEKTVPVTVETVAKGLEHPWGLQFLPDGRMLVTERPGRLRLIDAKGVTSSPLAGLPTVAAVNQGGLLDIALAPDFATSNSLHFCYSEPREGNTNGSTVARARLEVADVG